MKYKRQTQSTRHSKLASSEENGLLGNENENEAEMDEEEGEEEGAGPKAAKEEDGEEDAMKKVKEEAGKEAGEKQEGEGGGSVSKIKREMPSPSSDSQPPVTSSKVEVKEADSSATNSNSRADLLVMSSSRKASCNASHRTPSSRTLQVQVSGVGLEAGSTTSPQLSTKSAASSSTDSGLCSPESLRSSCSPETSGSRATPSSGGSGASHQSASGPHALSNSANSPRVCNPTGGGASSGELSQSAPPSVPVQSRRVTPLPAPLVSPAEAQSNGQCPADSGRAGRSFPQASCTTPPGTQLFPARQHQQLYPSQRHLHQQGGRVGDLGPNPYVSNGFPAGPHHQCHPYQQQFCPFPPSHPHPHPHDAYAQKPQQEMDNVSFSQGYAPYPPPPFHRDATGYPGQFGSNDSSVSVDGQFVGQSQSQTFVDERTANAFHSFDASKESHEPSSDRRNTCNMTGERTVNPGCQNGFSPMNVATGGSSNSTESSVADSSGRRSIGTENLSDGDADRASLMFQQLHHQHQQQQQRQQQRGGSGPNRQSSIEHGSTNFLYAANTPNPNTGENSSSNCAGEKANDLPQQFPAGGAGTINSRGRNPGDNNFFHAGDAMNSSSSDGSVNGSLYLHHHPPQLSPYEVNKYDAFSDASCYKESGSFYTNPVYPAMTPNFNASFVGPDGNQRMMSHPGAHAYGAYGQGAASSPYAGNYGNHMYGQSEVMFGMEQNVEMYNGYYPNEHQMVSM